MTGDERRLLAVIAVSDTAVDTLAGAPSTASADTMPNSSIPLQHVVARHEGHLDVLEDKTVVVSLTSAGAATDLASRAARCALAIREALPQARLSVASGRGDSSEPRAAAEVVARAQKLLSLGNLVATTAAGGTRRRDPSGEPRRHIRIDDVTAGLLDPSFDVSGDAAALTLVGQRDMHSVRKLLGKPTPCVGRERELAMLDGIVAERARAIADTFEATGYVRHSALVALHVAIAAVAVGDAAEGIAWAERAADLARRLGLRSHELRARAWLALHLGRTGLDELALATAEAALRDAGGDRVVEADARVHLATLRASTGDLEAAAREAASVWEDERFPLDARGRAGALLARLHLARDRVVEALATSDRALEALARACPLGDAEARETKRQALARSHAP